MNKRLALESYLSEVPFGCGGFVHSMILAESYRYRVLKDGRDLGGILLFADWEKVWDKWFDLRWG